MICPACKMDIPLGGRFCIHCGAELGAVVSPPSKIRRGQATLAILNNALREKFEIQEHIGSGGMGEVFRALHRQLNSRVAIKVLHEAYNSDQAMITRFQREARAAAQLSHPNIIPIYDIGVAADFNYFVMLYVQGEDLSTMLEREGALPVLKAISIAVQVANALEYAHRHGVVHRDIKPANILIDAENKAIVTDFGIARSLGADSITGRGAVVGTPYYLSPEQASGSIVDYRCDLYSLGVVLYQMLSGKLPYEASDPNALLYKHIYEEPLPLNTLRPDLDSELVAIVKKLMAKSPSDRYQDATAVARALSRLEFDTDHAPTVVADAQQLFDTMDSAESSRLPSVHLETPFGTPMDSDKAIPSTAADRWDKSEAAQEPPAHADVGKHSPGVVALDELAALALREATAGRLDPSHLPSQPPLVADATQAVSLEELAALAVKRHQEETGLTGAGFAPTDHVFSKSAKEEIPSGIVSQESGLKIQGSEPFSAKADSWAPEATRLELPEDFLSKTTLAEIPLQEIPETEDRAPAPLPIGKTAPSSSKWLVLVIIVAVLSLAIVIWLLMSRADSSGFPAISTTKDTVAPLLTSPAPTAPPTTNPKLAVATLSNDRAGTTPPAQRVAPSARPSTSAAPDDESMIDRYKQTLQIDPNNPQAAEGLRKIAQAYLELGKLSEASNDKAKARERYRKALEVNPQLREAREALKLLDAAPVAAESSNASSASRELTESRETVTAAGAATRAPRSGKPPMAGSGQTTKVKIYETTDVDVKPEAIFEVPPVYPSDALKRGLQDIIILKVLISEEGSVLDTQILRGARQDKQFEKAAIEAVQKWKFQPAQKGSQTVRVWFNVAVPFQISKQ